MYVNLRRYPKITADKEAIHDSVQNELLPQLREQEGFKGYCAFWDEAGAGVSVSVFADQEAAHRSTDTARQWVMRHHDFFPERGEEFSGACIAYETAHKVEQEGGGGGGAQSLFVLIRELDNVPGTQDTRAFVEQRTLPMITRSPGFRGVYTVRGDREGSRAAVVTLFDSEREAVACHEKAVELLREGLPRVTVTRVLKGQSVLLVVGD
jgi:heme-degrading monooxygenase HmoA